MQGHADFELSDEGRAQANKLHDRFQDEGLQATHVYSSPLRRTAETAEIISRLWPVSIVHRNSLKEHHIGIFSGMTWGEVAERYPSVSEDFHKSRDWDVVEGAETLAQRGVRARRVIDTMIHQHDNEDTVIVFTHGGILQHMLAALMGTERVWGMSVHNTAVFDFTLDVERWPASKEDLANSSFWRVNRFNDASHLTF